MAFVDVVLSTPSQAEAVATVAIVLFVWVLVIAALAFVFSRIPEILPWNK